MHGHSEDQTIASSLAPPSCCRDFQENAGHVCILTRQCTVRGGKAAAGARGLSAASVMRSPAPYQKFALIGEAGWKWLLSCIVLHSLHDHRLYAVMNARQMVGVCRS